MKYTCPRHDTEQEQGEGCLTCEEFLKTAPKGSRMTVEERIEEMHWWCDPDKTILTVNMGDMHERIEELMGRPVWTHELANPLNLIRELEREAA